MSESSTTKAVEWVVLIILIIIGVALVPTVVDTVATGMTGLTSASAKITSGAVVNASETIYGANWMAASFNMTQNCNVANVTLTMYKVGTPAGDITVMLECADDTTGKPNGTTVVSETLTAASITATVTGDNYTFDFTPTPIYAGANYSIVVKATSGNSSNYVKWMEVSNSVDETPYPMLASTDSGATWTQTGTKMFNFVLYGIYNLVGISVSAVLMGLIPFIFIVGLIIYFLIRLLRS
jgi:hypothetical protein